MQQTHFSPHPQADNVLNKNLTSQVNIEKFHFLKIKLAKQKVLPVKIITGSMAPFIKVDQKIEIEPAPTLENLKVFDVLVYWSQDILICHYLHSISEIINSKDRILITRGLNSGGADFPVKHEQLLGRAKLKMPWYFKLYIILRHRN